MGHSMSQIFIHACHGLGEGVRSILWIQDQPQSRLLVAIVTTLRSESACNGSGSGSGSGSGGFGDMYEVAHGEHDGVLE